MKRKMKSIVHMAMIGCMTVFLAACGTSTENGLDSLADISSYGQTEAQPAQDAADAQPENTVGDLPENAADDQPENAIGDLPENAADDLPGNCDLVKEILTFSNNGYLSDRIEYSYTADGLVERKREYFATEDTYEEESLSLLQETVYTYDEKSRVSLEQIFDEEGELLLTGTYHYDEDSGILTDMKLCDNLGDTIMSYEFMYATTEIPIISGAYIWSNFRDMYFNGNVENVWFYFGSDGEIVQCMAHSDSRLTGIPECVIDYTCDDSGAIVSMTCQNVTYGWGSYSCEYERSSRGIESVSYYYVTGENMRLETYLYDDKDRITGIDVLDEETGESYHIIYRYAQ